jgi:uncharacterized protein YecA (UPF0149 family)
MTLNRRILRKIDDKLRTESELEPGEWMAKVPISGATKAVWQRYCQAVGLHMGQGVALLINQELASLVDEDLETLSDRLTVRQAELDTWASTLAKSEGELSRRLRDLEVREARIRERELDVKKRETELDIVQRRLAQELNVTSRPQPRARPRVTLGRNDLCWCKSGKEYKNCHLASDQSG